MVARDIATSCFNRSLANGLSCRLSVCRCCPADRPHFDKVVLLSAKQFFRPGQPVDERAFKEGCKDALADSMGICKMDESLPDGAAAMSHKSRALMHAFINRTPAYRQAVKKRLPLRGEALGATRLPAPARAGVCACSILQHQIASPAVAKP